jgi:hypothetical protein
MMIEIEKTANDGSMKGKFIKSNKKNIFDYLELNKLC